VSGVVCVCGGIAPNSKHADIIFHGLSMTEQHSGLQSKQPKQAKQSKTAKNEPKIKIEEHSNPAQHFAQDGAREKKTILWEG